MTDIFSIETFLLKTNSLDGCPVIIGGICPKGRKQEAINIYYQIQKFKLGLIKDEYLIDVILADSLKKLSPNWILIVGASIFVEGVRNNTGGIIGNPFEDNESSNEEFEEVFPGLYLITMPGGPGIAFRGTHSECIEIKNTLIDIKKSDSINIEEVINKLDIFTNLYIVVQDGSGPLNCGGICVSDSNGKQYEKL